MGDTVIFSAQVLFMAIVRTPSFSASKAAEDGSSILVPATLVGDLNGVLGSWLFGPVQPQTL